MTIELRRRPCIEVADMSAATDRSEKLPAYARADIAGAWLVDVSAGVVEVHQGPSGTGYQRHTTRGRGNEVSVAAFPDVTIPVTEIVGNQYT